MSTGLNKLSKEIHNEIAQKGFYDTKRNLGESLMLVVTELSEALEAHRTGRLTESKDYDIIKKLIGLKCRSGFDVHFPNIKDTFEDEIADTMIRLLDLIGWLGIDIDFHIEAKRKYNEMRPYKHGKRY